MKTLTQTLTIAVLMLLVNYTFANSVQDRQVKGFNAIQLSASYDVYISQGTKEQVKIEASDDVINNIITEVQGSVLKIYNKRDHGWNFSMKKVVIHIVAINLNNIDLSGSGNVSFKDGINGNSLAIKVSGSGDVNGKVNVSKLEASISGSGNVKLYGKAANAAVSVSGSGDYSARDLVTQSTAIRVSGSGDATVNASQKIDAAVSGSGDISYTGGVKQVSTATHGSGAIHRI